jgi:hypothetical protein
MRSRQRRNERRLAEKMQQIEPRQEDRRQAERRAETLTPAQLEVRLRQLGLNADRRIGQRRRYSDRRR